MFALESEAEAKPIEAPDPTKALCVVSDRVSLADFFYEGRFRQNSEEYRDHVTLLRCICSQCPVKNECMAFAVDNAEGVGFWAGMTAWERYNEHLGPRPPGRTHFGSAAL